jgi:hypothetical protein
MIYIEIPENWRDLQEKVCSILQTCGCDASTETEIKTVRGPVVVDVLAYDSTQTPKLNYIVECKLWNTAVPKSVIHSFRTVVADSGAHIGFIVSKSGFQEGAYEAAKSSNIKLQNWNEFQEVFCDRWIEGRYTGMKKLFAEIFDYYDYFRAPIGNAISGNPERLKEYEAILERYAPQSKLNPWGQMSGRKRYKQPLPVQINQSDGYGNLQQITFHDFSSYFNWHEKQVAAGLKEFRDFAKKYRTDQVN